MAATKPVSTTILPWLKSNLGSTVELTGIDIKALQAAVHIVELDCYSPNDDLYRAFAAVVRQMQPKCLRFAYHAVAHVADWNVRRRWWHKAGLPDIEPGRCKYEPEATR